MVGSFIDTCEDEDATHYNWYVGEYKDDEDETLEV